MALTYRSNGAGGGIVSAQWWNDYYNLLTGAMTDQIVTLKTSLILQAIGGAPSAGPTLALAAGTTLGVGTYKYVVTFVDGAGGETLQSPTTSIATTTNNQAVSLTAIATGPTGTVKRKVYRTVVGGSVFKLCTTLTDNTTTTFTDTIADGSLGSGPPFDPTFGGTLFIQDQNGNPSGTLTSDGTLSLSGWVKAGNQWLLAYGNDNNNGSRQAKLYVGTTDPSTYATINEGDIWIKA